METRRAVIVGLGNPGKEYEDTYHNVGALALRACAGERAWKTYKKLFTAALTDRNTFVQPLTFMNESGRAVQEALKHFGAAPADLTVIHDDSDLPLGRYKISRNVRAAGHKGVQSIIDAIGTKDFARIRIGIRPPAERNRAKAGAFVLKTITKKDSATLRGIFDAIATELFLLR